MKRFFTRLSAVAMAVTMVMACSKEKAGNGDYLNAVPEDATAIVYIDGYQMIQKSGLLDQIKPFRELAANQAASMAGKDNADFAKSVVLDLDNSGIATTEPIYAAVTVQPQAENVEAVIIAKVSDKNKFDKLVAMANDNGAELEVENTDGCTILLSEEEACVAYNDAAIVIAAGDDTDCRQLAINTLKAAYTPRATALPEFKGYDAAVYLDSKKLVDLAKSDYNFREACEMYGDNIEMLGEGMICGLTFKPGRIALDGTVLGLSDKALATYESFYPHEVTNEYLKYLPADTYAVMSGYFNGKNIWDMVMNMPAVQEQLDQIKESLSEEIWQESMETAKNIFYGFDGDATMALNGIGNSNGDADVKASAMMTVVNDSVISLFEQYRGMLEDVVEQTGENSYRANMGDVTAYFGQQGSMLYASTEGVPAPVSPSAESAVWVKEIAGAKYFLAANLREIFADPLVNTMMWREVYNDRDMGDVARNLIDLLDYAYWRNKDIDTTIFEIVLRNSTDNALKQIVDTILPVVMQNFNITGVL